MATDGPREDPMMVTRASLVNDPEALEAAETCRRKLQDEGVTRFGVFRKGLKDRGITATAEQAAELYHAVEPRMGPFAGVAMAMGTLLADAADEEELIAGDQRPQPQPASSSRDGAAAASKGGTAATPAEVGSFRTEEEEEKAPAEAVPAVEELPAEEQPGAPPSAFVRGPVLQSWEMFGLQLTFASDEHQTLWEDALSSFFSFADADEPMEDVEERLAQGLALLEEGENDQGIDEAVSLMVQAGVLAELRAGAAEFRDRLKAVGASTARNLQAEKVLTSPFRIKMALKAMRPVLPNADVTSPWGMTQPYEEYVGGLMFFLQKGGTLEEPLAAKLRRLACGHEDPFVKELADGFLVSQGFQSDVELNSTFCLLYTSDAADE